jgi:hypothetical protein
MVFWDALVVGGRKLEAGKDLKAKRLGKELGAPTVLFIGLVKRDRGLRSWCISRETWKVEISCRSKAEGKI